jgi:hypothetical protein
MFDWVIVWMGGCSLLEGLIGIILVSQLVYLLILDDMDPFAASVVTDEDGSSSSSNTSTKSSHHQSNGKLSGGGGGGGGSGSTSSTMKDNSKGSLAGSDDLKKFMPKDAATALNTMQDCSNVWTQPPTFKDKNGLAVWHRPIGAAVHEFKFTVDINSEPAPV